MTTGHAMNASSTPLPRAARCGRAVPHLRRQGRRHRQPVPAEQPRQQLTDIVNRTGVLELRRLREDSEAFGDPAAIADPQRLLGAAVPQRARPSWALEPASDWRDAS